MKWDLIKLQKELLQKYPNIDKLREKSQFHTEILNGALIVGCLAFAFIFILGDGETKLISFVSLILYLIIVFHLTSHRDDFKKFFDSIKHEYIAAMLKQIDSSFEYSIETIPLDDVQKTGLFNVKHTEALQSNDYFTGEYKGIKIQIAEISFDSKDSKKGDNFFKPSTLIIAEFNKAVNSETIIFDNSFYDNGGTEKDSRLQVVSHSKRNSITLENPEFEGAFSTTSNDDIEARYILSHSFMERLLDLKYSLDKCKINLAFANNKVSILLYNKQIFEPSLSKSIKEDRFLLRFHKETISILKIIDTLRLNEKIWKR